jgi:hypothetical protein
MNGTPNYGAYWSDANTIAAVQFGPNTNGGTGITSAGATGIPKVTAGVWSINATQDDLPNGVTYMQYNPTAVAITGGSIRTSGLRLISLTSNQLLAHTTPTAIGQMYFCNNCTPPRIAVSNGLGLGNFTDMQGGALP